MDGTTDDSDSDPDELPVAEVADEMPDTPYTNIGKPLLDGVFAVSLEESYDTACAAAIGSGLLAESEVDTLTDALARVGPSPAWRDAVMKAQLASLWARQETAAAHLVLCALPSDLLTAVLMHAFRASVSMERACGARVLARCAATCRALHGCADEAACTIATARGLDFSISRCPTRILAQRRHAVRALHATLTALPHPFAPVPTTVDRLAALLAPFEPSLCAVPSLVLPHFERTRFHKRGQAEYVNFAAMLRGALGFSAAESSIVAIQRLVEAAWAEGIDREGGEPFDFRLETAPGTAHPHRRDQHERAHEGAGERVCAIGATELLAALLHLRIDATIVEVCQGVGGARALHEAVTCCLRKHEQGGTMLPMLLQWRGDSALVLGATSAPGLESLVLADPRDGGMVWTLPLSKLYARELRQDYQLLIIRGDGTRRVSLDEAQRRGAIPAAISQRKLARLGTPSRPRPSTGVRRWSQSAILGEGFNRFAEETDFADLDSLLEHSVQ